MLTCHLRVRLCKSIQLNGLRAQVFESIKRWAPYDNLKAQPYPPLLLRAGLHDQHVPVAELARRGAA